MSKIIEKSMQMPGTLLNNWQGRVDAVTPVRTKTSKYFKLLFVDFVEREIANPLRILLGSATSKQTTARSSKTNYLSNLVITFILKQQCDVREAWQGKPHAKTRSDVFWAYRSATPADGMLFL